MTDVITKLPLAFVTLGVSVIVGQVPDIPPQTAAGALVVGFTLCLGTLVWIVKKQLEAFPAALKDQQLTFAAALDKQNMAFASIIDKVREDNQKTLNLVAKESKE